MTSLKNVLGNSLQLHDDTVLRFVQKFDVDIEPVRRSHIAEIRCRNHTLNFVITNWLGSCLLPVYHLKVGKSL